MFIDDKTPKLDELEALVEEAEKRSKIKDSIWETARCLVRDGDVFQEPVISMVPDTQRWMIERLKTLPTKEMEADVDERGVFNDAEKPYIQRVPSLKDVIKFEWWRVIHYKTGNATYGYENSLFGNAALRIGKQLLWIDEALVIARLTRAWKRFAYMIDTKNLSPDDAMTYVAKFMDRLKTRTLITDPVRGRSEQMENPPLPDEDIGIPVGESTKADVKELSGDMNVSNIADVEYLQRKFLMAVTVPKAYVSLEEGVNARATMGYIDVQFARQVRRRQASLKPGLRRFYELVFTLAGVDHRSFKWDIEFPELATSDETLKWNLLQTKAAIATTLYRDLGVVNQDYVLRELLEFDDDMMKKYAAITGDQNPPGGDQTALGPDGQPLPPDQQALPGNTQGGNAPVQLPPQLAMMIRRDPQVRAMLDDLKDLVRWKVDREERLKGMVPVGLKATPVRRLAE